MTTEQFQGELDAVFAAARREGRASVDVNAGELHRELGGYPGPDHRMAACSQVLWNNYRAEVDEVVSAPPKGKGASLTIRYRLPRG